MKKFIIILSLVYSSSCYSQKESLTLDFRSKLKEDSLKLYQPKKVTFDFQFDNRNSFIKNAAISIKGINLGFNFISGVRWGIGFYKVIRPFQTFRSVDKQNIVTNRELDLYYVTPNFQYTFIDNKWIQTSVNLEIGIGKIDYKIFNEGHTAVVRDKTGSFIPSGAGVEVLITPIRWAGLDGMIGYRKSLKSYDINQDFDGMYYSYGLKVFLGVIYTDLKYHHHKKKLFKQHKEAQ
jgi:hypothetical protein